MIESLRGQTWLVIGLGKSGVACSHVLAGLGATVLVTDEKAVAELRGPIAEVGAVAKFVAPAALDDATLARTASAVLSPGVPLTSAVVGRVRDARVTIVGEVELAYRLCRAPIIAITGTKGKSTVTALTGHLLAGAGKNVRVGGNIGKPLVSEVGGLGPDDWIVAEVSSFQLETVDRFKPRVSVLLNVAPDHLDRYASMEEYAAAKFRIFARQDESDAFVGNLDDARVAALRSDAARPAMRAKQSWFTLAANADGATMYLENGTIFYAPAASRAVGVASASEIPLAGRHNVANAMAALLAAIAAGCDPSTLREPLASFRPMPHRLEPVAEIEGVLYVDDSKSTNPDATVAALHAYERPIVLIAGGRAKGTPFAGLGTAIRERAKRVIAIGEAAEEIVACAGGTPSQRARSMDEAVRLARAAAAAGDVVLLSPACASFDMFDSAEARGDRFAAAVRALRERAGA